jgi:hypothetical protein
MSPFPASSWLLSYSRAVWPLFTLDRTLESFLRGHIEAFHAFQGAARAPSYDNLRSDGHIHDFWSDTL